jgi:hypothetical protein
MPPSSAAFQEAAAVCLPRLFRAHLIVAKFSPLQCRREVPPLLLVHSSTHPRGASDRRQGETTTVPAVLRLRHAARPTVSPPLSIDLESGRDLIRTRSSCPPSELFFPLQPVTPQLGASAAVVFLDPSSSCTRRDSIPPFELPSPFLGSPPRPLPAALAPRTVRRRCRCC